MVFSQSIQHVVRADEPLNALTWARTGGTAKYFAEPTSEEEFAQIIQEASAAELAIRVCGDGSSVLVRDSGFDGVVIKLSAAALTDVRIDGEQLVAGAGAPLSHAISQAVGGGLAGIEYLAGIPGTIGGAVVCNAAVKNGDIGSRVVGVTTISPDGTLATKDRSELQFGFRRSNLDGHFLRSVTLKLEEIDRDELTRRMQAAWIMRRAAQPNSGTRCLHAFSEPDGRSLGEVLEAAQMKGHSEGEVKLSSEFPGFVVVDGAATSEQVIALIERVAKSVEARTGVRLQSQVRIW